MGKAKRKVRPEPPKWVWFETDGCWFCNNLNGCGGCKVMKGYVALQKKKRRNNARKGDINEIC